MSEHDGVLIEVRSALSRSLPCVQAGHNGTFLFTDDEIKELYAEHDETLTKLDAFIAAVPDDLPEHIETCDDLAYMGLLEPKSIAGRTHVAAKLLSDATTERKDNG